MPEVAPETTPLPEVTADEILRELNEAGRAGTAAKFSRYVAQRDAARALAFIMGSEGMVEAGFKALEKALSPKDSESISEPEVPLDPVLRRLVGAPDAALAEDPEATPPEPGKRKKGGK